MPVDEAAGDSDGLRDLLDRHVLEAALIEQRPGRGDELLLANLASAGGCGLRAMTRIVGP